MTVKKYASGLTVIVEENAALRSVTSGIMVGVGSSFETPENNGISHFIEHMQFKGTEKRTARMIVDEFDRAGCSYNAFTGKEYTCFYFKSIDEKTEQCFDVLADLFLNSVYAADELDRERKVIIEEINMSKDEPDGVCYDTLYRTAFGGALGMEILGTKDNVMRFGKPDMVEYKRTHYLPSDTVVAFVGNITEREAIALVEKYMQALIDAPFTAPPRAVKQTFNGGYGEYIKDYEQSEISIAYPTFALGDDRSATLSALDCILGSGMSSRLFQRLRENLGLVYSVYTSPWMGRTNGLFDICANVNVTNIEKSVAAVRDEIDKMTSSGVTAEETEKAKMQLKVNALFGKENPMNYMLALMRRRVMLDEDYDLDALIAKIDAVTPDAVTGLAREIFSRPAAVAYAGKKPPCNVYDVYNKRQ